MFKQLNLLILVNGWSARIISGGDYHILRVMKEWVKSYKIALVIPLIGFQSCQHMLSDKYKIYISSKESKGVDSAHAMTSYVKRIIKTLLLRFSEKPDVIVCSSHLLYDTLPGFIMKLRFRSKLVVYVHHILSEYSQDRSDIFSKISIIAERLSLPLARHAELILVVNQQVKESLVSKGFDRNKIILTSNGLDYETIESIRPIPDQIYDGCFCGRLVRTKGIFDLIEIWKLVTNRCPSSKLVIIGDGPEFKDLEETIKNAGLDENIVMKGFITETEKFRTMYQSRIFVFPSYEEGWGIAIAESLACGLEVVSYDLPAYKNDNERFTKVEKGNIVKMADVILNLISSYGLDKSKRRSIADKTPAPDWGKVATGELAHITKLTVNSNGR